MNKSISIIGGVILIGILAWLVFSGSSDTQNGMVGMTSARVPDFALSNYNGQTVSLNDFAGKPLVINSWAAWCPFCVKELKDFGTVQRELGDKVVFIAVDRAESLETAKNFTDENGVTDELVFLLDPEDSFYQAIGGFSMPETIFVDSAGTIVDHKRGPMEIGEIRERAQRILN